MKHVIHYLKQLQDTIGRPIPVSFRVLFFLRIFLFLTLTFLTPNVAAQTQSRLPIPNQDSGQCGDFLRVSHNEDGTLNSVGAVNIKSFGAVGDGVADDTTAFQAALDQVKGTGKSIYIPNGMTIRVTNTLVYMPGVSTNGPTIIGVGRGNSKILFDFSNGQPLFKVWNTTPSRYMENGGFSKLEITSPGGSQDSQGAVFSLSGWWHYNVNAVYVHHVRGDVVMVPDRTAESGFGNVDYAESYAGVITNSRFQFIDGYGYAGRNGVAASVHIERTYFGECQSGAILSGGAGLFVIDNSFGANGRKGTTNNPTVLIQRQVGNHGQRFAITGNEFQGSAGPHLRIQGGMLGLVNMNRFITDPWPPFGAGSWPALAVDLNPDAAGGQNMYIDFTNNLVRRSTTDPFTFMDLHSSGNNYMINIHGIFWVGGTTGLTKFANVPGGSYIDIVDR